MRKLPLPSVTTDLTFSMSTGLAASTVTPGIAAPDTSRTVPVMMLCAYAVDDISVANTNTYHALRAALRAMLFPSQLQIQALRLANPNTTRCDWLAQDEPTKRTLRPAKPEMTDRRDNCLPAGMTGSGRLRG